MKSSRTPWELVGRPDRQKGMKRTSSIMLSLAVSLGLIVSACSRDRSSSDPRTLAATSGPNSTSRLVVDQRRVGGALYAEGAFSYLTLETSDGRPVLEEEFTDTRLTRPLVDKTLSAGSYRMLSYQRPCDASCPGPGATGYLDPPTDRCSVTFELLEGQLLRASVELRPGEGCAFRFKD